MKLKGILTLGLTLFVMISKTHGQIQAVEIEPTKDAHVYSGSAGSNYGTSSVVAVWRSSYLQRTFLEADLSSIPSNAIIISADLQLKVQSYDNSPSHPFYVERVTASWSEGSITWSNQPAATSSDQISVPHENVSVGTISHMDVVDHVQYMVNYPALNYGWRIRLQNESSGVCGVQYHSSEASLHGNIPKLDIEYVLPIEISGTVIHSENGQDNGAIIDIDVDEGSGTYDSYTWLYYDSGTSSTVESGSNIANAEIDNLEPGLYLLTVTDDEGTSNYKYFLLGEEGEETTVSIHPNNAVEAANYSEDCVQSSTSPDANYGTYTYFNAMDWSTYLGEAYMKWQLDFDQSLVFTEAELQLKSFSPLNHINPSGCSNASTVSLVTEYWEEDLLTYNTKPTKSGSISEAIPETAASEYRNDDVDLLEFVGYWQGSPTENFGINLALNSYTCPYNCRLIYANSDYATESGRPTFVLSFRVREIAFATPQKELRGGYYEVPYDERLRFEFYEEYDKIGDLNYVIKDKEGQDITGSLDALPVEFGDNRFTLDVSSLASGFYVMEIRNGKNEKWYLRFKMG